MILRHVEAVTIDERGLDQRPHRFSESKCDKLPLHHPQEPQVRMVLARKGPRNSRRYIVASKLDLLPLTRDNHVASKGTYLWLGWAVVPIFRPASVISTSRSFLACDSTRFLLVSC